jgi:hypothetical protein
LSDPQNQLSNQSLSPFPPTYGLAGRNPQKFVNALFHLRHFWDMDWETQKGQDIKGIKEPKGEMDSADAEFSLRRMLGGVQNVFWDDEQIFRFRNKCEVTNPPSRFALVDEKQD